MSTIRRMKIGPAALLVLATVVVFVLKAPHHTEEVATELAD